MRTHSVKILGVAIAALAFASSTAGAQGSVMQVLRDGARVDARDERRSNESEIERARRIERERRIARERYEMERRREIERARARNDDRIYGDRDRDDDDRDGDRKWKKNKKGNHGLSKKPGNMPPGQYKKRYETTQGASVLGDIMRRDGYSVLRTIPRDGSQYVYYRTRDGQERRAIVSQGNDRLSFSNVPQSVLEQVLSALYR